MATAALRARGRRTPILAMGAVAVLAAFFLGIGGAGAAAGDPEPTTTSMLISIVGSSVTFSATVTGTTAAPTGSVNFADPSGNSFATAALTPSGALTSTASTTVTLHAGDTYTAIATYISDDFAAFATSESPPQQFTIPDTTHRTTSTVLAISPAAPTAGGTLTLTATVTSDTAPTPTGTVTFATLEGGTTHFLAQGDLSGGTVSVDVPGWAAGTYTIQASYGGDSIYNGSHDEQQVTVASNGSILLETTTTVSVSPNPVPAGASTVTIVAHVIQTGTSNPAAGDRVTFFARSDFGEENLGEAPLVDGVATLSRTGWRAGRYTIEADYFGSQFDRASPPATTSLDVTAPSSLVFDGAFAGTTGSPITLQATLSDGGSQAIAGRTVQLHLGTSGSCSGTTGAGGHVSCAIPTVLDSAGSVSVTASFAGDTTYSPSSTTAAVTIGPPTVPIATHLTYVGDTFAPPGTPASISFRLTSDSGATLAGRAVHIDFDGHALDVVTDGAGVAQASVPAPTTPGPHTANATFAGDASYQPSTGSGTLVSSIPTAISYNGDTTVVSTGDATLGVTLVSLLDHMPVTGASVTIALATGETCTATTDAAGIATCTRAIAEPAGNDTVTVSYGGDAPYLGSSSTGTLTVTATDSTIVLAPVAPTLQGASAQLGATLTSTQTGRPLAGKPVTLTLGAQTCTATTDASGAAGCTIPSVTAPVGTPPTSASFAGDASAHQALTATGLAIVYGLAPGGGTFVVGDRSATGKVTFWGAQWAKVNALSGGSAPSSFKGFSDSATPGRCAVPWTSRPGNSTPPPKTPLPAYMAVVVSSSISKSGSTIAGDVKKIVVVKTDRGYAPDPGHAGTGTVVATVCG